MQTFDVVEIQQTFYQPPQVATLQKWRQEAPEHFEFTLKAWQLITHTSSSPTHRRLHAKITGLQKSEAGSFRPTPTVRFAYELSVECALALSAKRLVFQCPGSFKPTEENLENMRRFFSSIERPAGLKYFWEPRGDWPEDLIRILCCELDLHHVVDPFINQVVSTGEKYYRLHGIGGWRHVYTDAELINLLRLLPVDASDETVLVMFNNGQMVADAQRYCRMVESHRTNLL